MTEEASWLSQNWKGLGVLVTAATALVKAFTGDASVEESARSSTQDNVTAVFGVVTIVRDELQRQIDELRDALDEVEQ